MNEKTDNIIETLEGIRDKLDKKLVEKRLKGLGNCSICGQYTDGADLFTCGNPQCDNELRQELSSRKELLRILDVGSLADVIKGLQQIQAIADEIKSKL